MSHQKYETKISGVREVTLRGTADLAYWRKHLGDAGLHAADFDGRAEILIGTNDAKFKGIAFRELTISVAVTREPGGNSRDGVFMMYALNSVKFFAWVERAFFKTPYYHGDIEITPEPPARVYANPKTAGSLELKMAGTAPPNDRQPTRRGFEHWEGPVFLPALGNGSGAGERVFFGKLEGEITAYPFTDADEVIFAGETDWPALRWLNDSGFKPDEWQIRLDGRHGKSKTRRLRDIPQLWPAPAPSPAQI